MLGPVSLGRIPTPNDSAPGENIAAAVWDAAHRHAEEMPRYQEYIEETSTAKDKPRLRAKCLKGSVNAWTSRGAKPRGRSARTRSKYRSPFGCGASEDGQWSVLVQLMFYDIPWPVAMAARSFDKLQAGAVERFLL
ncbi:hypothetical protein FRC09_006030 [Ceratobasidium sp. 395]|nr:hypothetical protein FRC09_006030 [Ceratobasidium sp. 395]